MICSLKGPAQQSPEKSSAAATTENNVSFEEPRAAFRFVDVAAGAGLASVRTWAGRPGKDHLLDSAGTGAAFLDFDRDGRLDIYLPNGWRLDPPAAEGQVSRVAERGRNALFRGKPDGTFEDVTERSGTAGEERWSSGAFAADYDGDGWTDILVTCFGPNLLYHNRGDGTFENVARAAGIESPAWNTGASFFDADGDGDLDLYIAAYIDCTLEEVLGARRKLDWKGLDKVAAGPFGMRGGRDRFFRAEPGGRFVEATAVSGFEDKALGFGFATRAADYDGDSDLDLYVANDSDANYYFRNEGGCRFKEIGLLAGCAFNADGSTQASMGVAAGDVNGDGIFDLFVTSFSEDSCTLYKGFGGGLFSDESAPWGLRLPTWMPLSWGCVFADFDSDGDLDVVIANGHIYPQVDLHPQAGHSYAQLPLLLENVGGKFMEAGKQAGPGFARPRSARGLAAGDFDNDGDLDLLITCLDEAPELLRNDSRSGAWLVIVLENEKGPISAVGTEVLISAGGRKFRRDVAAGDSYLSTHDPRLHFGLGKAEKAEEVRVRWPDKSVTLIRDVPARQFLQVKKGR